jgi:hypothetical protein
MCLNIYPRTLGTNHHTSLCQSEIDKIEVDKIEQERVTYAEALAAARENPNEEHLSSVAEARSRLQVLVVQ